MKRKNKIKLFLLSAIFIIGIGLIIPAISFAQESADPIKLQIAIPGLGDKVQSLSQYIFYFYKFLVGTAGVLAMVMMMWGGFKRLYSFGSSSLIQSSNETIISALIGLVIALASYFLLNLIDPRMVNLKTLNITPVHREEIGGLLCENWETGTLVWESNGDVRSVDDPNLRCEEQYEIINIEKTIENGQVTEKRDPSGRFCLGSRCDVDGFTCYASGDKGYCVDEGVKCDQSTDSREESCCTPDGNVIESCSDYFLKYSEDMDTKNIVQTPENIAMIGQALQRDCVEDSCKVLRRKGEVCYYEPPKGVKLGLLKTEYGECVSDIKKNSKDIEDVQFRFMSPNLEASLRSLAKLIREDSQYEDLQGNVVITSIIDNKLLSGKCAKIDGYLPDGKTCSHSINSCHYGGSSVKNFDSNHIPLSCAVDLVPTKIFNYYPELIKAVKASGFEFAQCECKVGDGKYPCDCKNPGPGRTLDHIHASVIGCGPSCDGHD